MARSCVQLRETAFVQEGLAADLQEIGRVPRQSFWHGANRPNVLGNVVASASVTAGGSITKLALFVEKRDGDSVHFWLNDYRDLFVRQQALHSPVEIGYLFFRIGVVEAEHRHAMGDLPKGFQRLSADALGRRIGRRQVWELRFEIAQLTEEAVIFAIADARRSLFVVTAVVFLDRAPELGDSISCRSFCFRHGGIIRAAYGLAIARRNILSRRP